MMMELHEKFNHLYQVISSPRFLSMEALGGEIPFFISAYDPSLELKVRESIRMLINRLETSGVGVLDLNLYDICCEILDEKGGMERMFRVEKRRPKDKFLNAMQSSLNIHEILIPQIKNLIDASNAKVYFLTGIGLVFPYIRSHTILNNLQNVAKNAPTVCFFPGEYTGQSLNLFGLLKDDNYYRAFNIDNIEVR